MVWFSTSPPKSMEIIAGWGGLGWGGWVSTAKFSKGKYDTKLEFPEVQNKENPSVWGSMDALWNQINI